MRLRFFPHQKSNPILGDFLIKGHNLDIISISVNEFCRILTALISQKSKTTKSDKALE